MYPILFSWRGIPVYSYHTMLYAATVCGLVFSNYLANLAGMSSLRVLVAMLLLLFPGLIGARLLFVLTHLHYYRAHPDRAWHRRGGGLSQTGGVMLALLASAPLLAFMKLPWLSFWDVAVVGLLLGLAIGKVGCLLRGCCAGHPSASRLALILPNHEGKKERRLPSQLFEASAAALTAAAAMAFWDPRLPPGSIFFVVMAGHGVIRFVLGQFRETQSRLAGLNVSSASSAALVLAGCTGLAMTGSS